MSFSTHAEYDLTKNPQAVPQFLLDAWVLTVSVEFLELNSKGVAVTEMNNERNHVVLKFSLLHKVEGLMTVCLDMRMNDSRRRTESDDGYQIYQLGKLIIYTLDRKREYTCSARTYTVHLIECLKFEEIILDITESGIQHFSFVNVHDSIQVLHLRKAKRHIGSRVVELDLDSPTAINDIYQALGQRYTPKGIFECPIDRGIFEGFIDKGYLRNYERQETDGMPYAL
ncbi:unnamed protein product [Clonostachys rhizophaga]|uniref:Uncharacterized protein n=1 Tax=Clonostachys rhizophaga TaxID=160324 RepID=A0A9N9YUN5_9HYPO|nr:unnamed protein product [Clonostachys rhizophaga]